MLLMVSQQTQPLAALFGAALPREEALNAQV